MAPVTRAGKMAPKRKLSDVDEFEASGSDVDVSEVDASEVDGSDAGLPAASFAKVKTAGGRVKKRKVPQWQRIARRAYGVSESVIDYTMTDDRELLDDASSIFDESVVRVIDDMKILGERPVTVIRPQVQILLDDDHEVGAPSLLDKILPYVPELVKQICAGSEVDLRSFAVLSTIPECQVVNDCDVIYLFCAHDKVWSKSMAYVGSCMNAQNGAARVRNHLSDAYRLRILAKEDKYAYKTMVEHDLTEMFAVGLVKWPKGQCAHFMDRTFIDLVESALIAIIGSQNTVNTSGAYVRAMPSYGEVDWASEMQPLPCNDSFPADVQSWMPIPDPAGKSRRKPCANKIVDGEMLCGNPACLKVIEPTNAFSKVAGDESMRLCGRCLHQSLAYGEYLEKPKKTGRKYAYTNTVVDGKICCANPTCDEQMAMHSGFPSLSDPMTRVCNRCRVWIRSHGHYPPAYRRDQKCAQAGCEVVMSRDAPDGWKSANISAHPDDPTVAICRSCYNTLTGQGRYFDGHRGRKRSRRSLRAKRGWETRRAHSKHGRVRRSLSAASSDDEALEAASSDDEALEAESSDYEA